MTRAIRNHDSAEVYDPFLGSGTTIVAAEGLKRKLLRHRNRAHVLPSHYRPLGKLHRPKGCEGWRTGADMRGRKPTPTKQRILRGNPGKRPLNGNEPVYPSPGEEFDAIPDDLQGNVLAASEWHRLAPMLRRTGHVAESDRTALIAMCLEWARYIEATKKIRELGMVVKAPSGYPIVNPYLSIATKALAGCNKLWPELGLTPSSRSRVNATDAKSGNADPFAEFDQRPAVN